MLKLKLKWQRGEIYVFMYITLFWYCAVQIAQPFRCYRTIVLGQVYELGSQTLTSESLSAYAQIFYFVT